MIAAVNINPRTLDTGADHSLACARIRDFFLKATPHWAIALILLSGVLASVPQAHGQLSLSTVVDLAQKNSSAVKLANADLRKANAIFAEAWGVYIPSLAVGSSIGPPSIGFPSGQPSIASASMQSLAFSFPQHQYTRAARTGIEAAEQSLKDAQEQVTLEASVNYIELDTVREQIATMRKQAEFAARLVEIEQLRTEAGVDPRSELLQAELTDAQLRISLLHLKSRAAGLASQIAALTGLPAASITTEHSSIPEVPALHGNESATVTAGIKAAQSQARSRQFQFRGDSLASKILPIIAFGAQYSRDSTLLNNYSYYYRHFKADNFSAGFSIQVPLFDQSRRAKMKESGADALRASVEAEQAQRQNDIQIANLSSSLAELDALSEVASLKQQISAEQLKAVESQLQLGNGAGTEPGAPAQLSPKAEQLARIDVQQKQIESLEAGFDLNKARLSLLRALGHMDDWLHELPQK